MEWEIGGWSQLLFLFFSGNWGGNYEGGERRDDGDWKYEMRVRGRNMRMMDELDGNMDRGFRCLWGGKCNFNVGAGGGWWDTWYARMVRNWDGSWMIGLVSNQLIVYEMKLIR
jgi:hypothetical protein